MANFGQTLVITNLGTTTLTVPVTDPQYFIQGKITLPTLPMDQNSGSLGAPPSALVVTINKNGTPFYTGTAGAEGFRATFSGTIGDTITVVLTSAAAVDNLLNAIKMTLSWGEGF